MKLRVLALIFGLCVLSAGPVFATQQVLVVNVPADPALKQLEDNCTISCNGTITYAHLWDRNPLYNWQVSRGDCQNATVSLSFPGAEIYAGAIWVIEGRDTSALCQAFSNPWNLNALETVVDGTPPITTGCFENNGTLEVSVCLFDETFVGSAFIILVSDQCEYELLGPILLNGAEPCRSMEVPALDTWGFLILMGLLSLSCVIFLRRRKVVR